jgi:hypothetical protein
MEKEEEKTHSLITARTIVLAEIIRLKYELSDAVVASNEEEEKEK